VVIIIISYYYFIFTGRLEAHGQIEREMQYEKLIIKIIIKINSNDTQGWIYY